MADQFGALWPLTEHSRLRKTPIRKFRWNRHARARRMLRRSPRRGSHRRCRPAPIASSRRRAPPRAFAGSPRGGRQRRWDRLTDVDEADLAASIHGARKDLKKLRALLRLVREELGTALFKVENHRYRDAGQLLAGSRDAEVKLQTLIALRSRLAAISSPPPRPRSGRAKLEAERDEDRRGSRRGGADRSGQKGDRGGAREDRRVAPADLEHLGAGWAGPTARLPRWAAGARASSRGSLRREHAPVA